MNPAPWRQGGDTDLSSAFRMLLGHVLAGNWPWDTSGLDVMLHHQPDSVCKDNRLR
jgi:hypothetical protein